MNAALRMLQQMHEMTDSVRDAHAELARSAPVNEVTDIAGDLPKETGGTDEAFQKVFDAKGDFAALTEAEKFITERGFSFGALQGAAPIAIMLGEIHVPKWRYLGEDVEWLHGRLDSDNWRAGPVTLSIRKDAPQAVIDAIADHIAQASVEGRT